MANNQNHIQNAGNQIANGFKNAANKAAQGNLMDASQSAWNGTVSAAQELGKSVNESTQFLTGTQRSPK